MMVTAVFNGLLWFHSSRAKLLLYRFYFDIRYIDRTVRCSENKPHQGYKRSLQRKIQTIFVNHDFRLSSKDMNLDRYWWRMLQQQVLVVILDSIRSEYYKVSFEFKTPCSTLARNFFLLKNVFWYWRKTRNYQMLIYSDGEVDIRTV